jgi:hypothetical protein
MSARVLSIMALISACSAWGTAQVSSDDNGEHAARLELRSSAAVGELLIKVRLLARSAGAILPTYKNVWFPLELGVYAPNMRCLDGIKVL